jgi:hypothetical protein
MGRRSTTFLPPPHSKGGVGRLSKAKGILKKAKARTLQALFEATTTALRAVGEEDARGFFGHCGYLTTRDH